MSDDFTLYRGIGRGSGEKIRILHTRGHGSHLIALHALLNMEPPIHHRFDVHTDNGNSFLVEKRLNNHRRLIQHDDWIGIYESKPCFAHVMTIDVVDARYTLFE